MAYGNPARRLYVLEMVVLLQGHGPQFCQREPLNATQLNGAPL